MSTVDIVAGHHVDIKSGYLYSEAGRYGEVPQIDVTKLEQNGKVFSRTWSNGGDEQ